MSENNLSIGQLAKEAEVNVETVRYYQRRKLLATPAQESGIRRYNDDHLARLRFIKRAQSTGFTLEEIAELLDLNDASDHQVAQRLAALKLTDIKERISKLEKMKTALETLVHQCKNTKKLAPCPIIKMDF